MSIAYFIQYLYTISPTHFLLCSLCLSKINQWRICKYFFIRVKLFQVNVSKTSRMFVTTWKNRKDECQLSKFSTGTPTFTPPPTTLSGTCRQRSPPTCRANAVDVAAGQLERRGVVQHPARPRTLPNPAAPRALATKGCWLRRPADGDRLSRSLSLFFADGGDGEVSAAIINF